MISNPGSGVVSRKSHHSLETTIQKLERVFESKGIKLFCIIDHSGEAKSVGLQMPDTKLLIFGNAKAGTPIMLASPSAALDLPLKILVSEGSNGDVWLSWNSTSYLQDRHGFSQELANAISGIEALATFAGD